ncbi:MAG: nuclear transport factor 2 family protein [Acidobacteriota bacterium]
MDAIPREVHAYAHAATGLDGARTGNHLRDDRRTIQTCGPRRRRCRNPRSHREHLPAFVDKDRRKLEATHGSEWRGFTPWSGHVIRGRDGYMNEATFPPALPKDQGMVGYRIGEFDIVFYEDTAVVSFVAEVDRLSGSEKSQQTLTFVDVYHKEPGGWIQVASNTSLHPDEIGREMSRYRRLGDDERGLLMTAPAGNSRPDEGLIHRRPGKRGRDHRDARSSSRTAVL